MAARSYAPRRHALLYHCKVANPYDEQERPRNEGVIGDEAMHRIERDLDLEESHLEA